MNARTSLAVAGLILFFAKSAAAGDIDDTVYLNGGGRIRGLIVEESPKVGVRIKMPDGNVRAVAPKDLDHVKYGGRAAPPPPPAPVAPARLRLRATCAKKTNILGTGDELVVEEVGDGPDRALKAAGTDPQILDYDLPSGPHRIRVRAKRCSPHEEQVTLEPGATLEFAPHLDEAVAPLVPIAFARPPFAEANEPIEVLDSDGKAVCANLPCTANVPAYEQRYYLKWTPSSGKPITVNIPDPGEGADKSTFEGRVYRTTSVGMQGPAVMGAGAFVSFLGLLVIANTVSTDGDDVGIDVSGRRKTGAEIAIGGAVVIVGGAILLLAGVGRSEKLSVSLVSPEKPSQPVARSGITPSGLGFSF